MICVVVVDSVPPPLQVRQDAQTVLLRAEQPLRGGDPLPAPRRLAQAPYRLRPRRLGETPGCREGPVQGSRRGSLIGCVTLKILDLIFLIKHSQPLFLFKLKSTTNFTSLFQYVFFFPPPILFFYLLPSPSWS